MAGLRLQTIVDSVSSTCNTELCRLRAIYRWMARYITLDAPAARNPERHNSAAWITLRDRAANSAGYAALFLEACNLARIRCTTVCGTAKAFPGTGDEPHCWNQVQLKDQTYYIDVAWSAGITDRDYRNFDARWFDDAWFMTNKHLFNLSHYPTDKQLQELARPVTKQLYRQSTAIRPGAEIYEVFPFSEQRVSITGLQHRCLRLQYYAQKPGLIGGVFFGNDQESADTEADAYLMGNRLYVDIPLEHPGRQDLWIKINDRIAFGYLLDVRKAVR